MIFDWKCKYTWIRSSKNTLWCLLGCSIGDFGTILFFQLNSISWQVINIMILAIFNGLITSIILEIIILSNQMNIKKAFNTAKKIRTETQIQRGSVSVANVAVELAGKIFDQIYERTVMVIGAGDTSEKAARALLSRGAKSVIVSNRSFDRAEQLASELGGKAVQFDDWENEFAGIDIIISSTSAPHYVIDRKKLEPLQAGRHHRPLLLVDIAVPRDIEPEVNFLEDVYLYNIDDLQAIADDYLRLREEEIAKCETIIRAKAEELIVLLEAFPSVIGQDSMHPAVGKLPVVRPATS